MALDEPTLIVSQDTDLATQAARVVASLTGVEFSQVKDDLAKWEAYLATSATSLPMMVDHPVDASEVDGLLTAAEEFYGVVPRLVVVDVWRNVVRGGAYEDYMDAIRELHRVARRRHTTIVVLHHVNRQGGNSDGTKPIRLSDGKYGGEDEAEIVLGLSTPKWVEDTLYGSIHVHEPILRVAVLKNRNGPKDPEGRDVYVDLSIDYERMRIG